MKIMVLFYPGCIEFEVMLAAEILNKKFPVEVITPDGKDHAGSNGMVIKAAKALAEVDVKDYKAALFPGGNPDVLIGNQMLNEVVRQLNADGVILGAICAGPVILEQAGLLENRRMAHGFRGSQLKWLRDQGHFLNTTFTNEVFIVDENFVTARPEAFIDFAIEVACLAGVIEPDRRGSAKAYYRGKPV